MSKEIIFKAIIDIAGKPSEAVSQALDKVEEKIEQNSQFEIVEFAKAEPELQEEQGGLFTAFIDLELKCDTPRDAMAFIVEYLPSSIEIVEPSTLKVSSEELGDVLNDMVHFQIKNVNENHRLKVHNHNLQKRLQELEK